MVPCPPGHDPDQWAGYWLEAMLESQEIVHKKRKRAKNRGS